MKKSLLAMFPLLSFGMSAAAEVPPVALPPNPPQEGRAHGMKPLDARVPIFKQIEADESPVVLVNIFTVDEADIPAFMKAWEADANWMKQQPGFISTQLHRGIAGSTVFMNYAVWDSTENFRNAFTNPEFRKTLKAYPSSAVASPHLFKKVAVPNLCTD